MRRLPAAVTTAWSRGSGVRYCTPSSFLLDVTTHISRASCPPPRRPFNWLRTRTLGVVNPQQGHVAEPRLTVPSNFGSTIASAGSSWATHPQSRLTRILRSTRFAFWRGTKYRTIDRFAFLASHIDLISGTSAPQLGPSHFTVRAHRYATGIAPSESFG